MNRNRTFLAAGVLMLLPAIALAQKTSNGSTNGKGWTHSNGPATTGQPDQSCGSLDAPDTPGDAADAPGSAFNPDGNAGTHYAGQQPQNSRNSASVSQYDVACSNQPPD